MVSFVCSVGNIPPAAVLWRGEMSFGEVASFIFADLISGHRCRTGDPFSVYWWTSDVTDDGDARWRKETSRQPRKREP